MKNGIDDAPESGVHLMVQGEVIQKNRGPNIEPCGTFYIYSAAIVFRNRESN